MAGPDEPAAGDDSDPLPGYPTDRYRIMRRLGGTVYEALDTALDRRVALRLRPHRSAVTTAALEARLRRDAQALARLHHPNVVAVLDTGVTARGLFVAMELVDGVALDQVLVHGGGRLGWRRAVAVITAAGRGLAAAHAAGTVHGSLQPSNILVDRHGDVKVGDFGLARAGDDAELGAPRYLAPEQLLGTPATVQSDQFALCVTFFEALYGQHPFSPGQFDPARALVAMRADRVVAPRGSGVPRSVERAVRRGLRFDPDARWPSVDALLAAVAPSTRRWPWLVAGAAVLVVAGTAVAALIATRPPDPAEACRAVAARIAEVWPGQRGAMHAALDAARHPRGDAIEATVDTALTSYTRRLRAHRLEVCAASPATAGESPPRRDLRITCLDTRRAILTEVVDRFHGPLTPGDVERAIATIHAMPAPEDCVRADLTALTPPPSAISDRVADIARRVALARLWAEGGDRVRAGRALETLVGEAETTGYGSALAGVLVALGQHIAADAPDRARAAFERALALASRDRDQLSEIAALTGLVALAASKPDAARLDALIPVLRAVVARTGDRAQLAAAEVRMGIALVRVGRRDRARAACQHALEIMRDLPVPDDAGLAILQSGPRSEALVCLATAALDDGDADAALTLVGTALVIDDARLGVDALASAGNMLTVARVLRSKGRHEHAIGVLRRVSAIYDRAYPPDHPARGDVALAEASALVDTGRAEEALIAGERAVAVLGPRGDSPFAATAHSALASAHQLLEHRVEALAEYETACTMFERVLPPAAPDLAMCLTRWADALVAWDEPARGLEILRRAQRIFEQASHRHAVRLGTGIGTAYARLGRYHEAIAILERTAVAAPEDPDVLPARLALADALWDSRRDRHRALRIALDVKATAIAGGPDRRDALDLAEQRLRRWSGSE